MSTAAPGALARFLDGDVWYSLKRSPMAISAAVIAFVCIFCAAFANLVGRPAYRPPNNASSSTLTSSAAACASGW